ncbi:MAG TPA: response regulator transcription factor, partial [Gemmatimonadaceae bacterium]|nr:response regulator transcription factor [Gemmatimonadaceae bacterium]
NLSLEGYETCIAEDGRRALAVAEQWVPDVILLDLMLPELDGYQVLQTLRGRGVKTPVVILTAKAEEADKVRGFRLDADQYVTKPFGVLELLERVRALLRRSARDRAPPSPPPLHFGDVVVDTSSRMVTRNGTPCALTPKAYELLLALVRRAGAVATRNELLKEVWGYSAFVTTRTVDSHVAELRRKIEADPANPRHVKTVWKVGYRFER